MKKVFFIFLSCAGVFLFLHFSAAEPAPSAIVVTEVGAYESTQHEWIEVYNSGQEPVDVANWIFWEGGVNHELTLARGANMVLEPETFAIIAQNADNFLQDYPFVTSTMFDSAWGTLNESGEEVGLKDAAGEFVEKFIYLAARDFSLERRDSTSFDYSENNWSEHESGNTIGKRNSSWLEELTEEESQEIKDESDDENDEVQNTEEIHEVIEETENISEQEDETESSALEITTPSTTEQQGEADTSELQDPHIVINELLPYPIEGKEWVELFNDSSSTAHLVAWSLWDGVGQVTAVSSTIDAHGFLLVELPSAKLNNSGDAVVLKDALGNVIDQVIYGDWGNKSLGNIAAPKRGVGLARSDNEFLHTTTLTPSTTNVITEPLIPQTTQNRLSTPRSETQPKSFGAQYPVSSVVINELVSVPKKEGEEWVELYNNTNDWVDLGGWSVEDGAGTKTNISGTLPPHGFFVINQPRGKLNNSGDRVILRDPSEAVIDDLVYGIWESGRKENPPAPSPQQSLARFVDGQDIHDNKKDFGATQSVTKGGPNVIEIVEAAPSTPLLSRPINSTSSTVESSKVEVAPQEFLPRNISGLFISEIFPNPFGSDTDEFVELGNRSTTTIHLGGLLLDDVEGGSRPFRIPDETDIAPGGFVVFAKDETRLTLNNTSDIVRVLSDENILLEVAYDDAVEGASYAYDASEGWRWTEEVTPGAENVFEFIEEEETEEKKLIRKQQKSVVKVKVQQVKELDVGTRVMLTGVVAVEPHIFGSQYFYLMDTASSSYAGVQVYMYSKNFPSLDVGDRVQVVGEVSQTSGQKRIKVKDQEDFTIFDNQGELSPQLFEVGAIGEEVVGSFLSVQGEVTEKKSKYIYVDDGTDEVQVYGKAGLSLDFSELSVGGHVQIAGILIQTKNGYQLLPRTKEDIQKIEISSVTREPSLAESQPLEQSDQTREPYIVAGVGGVASVLLGVLGKLRGAVAWRWGRKVVSIAAASIRKKG